MKRLNVCGIVVHLAPARAEEAVAALRAMPGVDLHERTADGRVVLTAIDTDQALAIDQLTAMHRLPGVVSASLAYHAFDDVEDDACCCGGTGTCKGTPAEDAHPRPAASLSPVSPAPAALG